MSRIGYAILCLGLLHFGYEHDSTWAFIGATYTFVWNFAGAMFTSARNWS